MWQQVIKHICKPANVILVVLSQGGKGSLVQLQHVLHSVFMQCLHQLFPNISALDKDNIGSLDAPGYISGGP